MRRGRYGRRPSGRDRACSVLRICIGVFFLFEGHRQDRAGSPTRRCSPSQLSGLAAGGRRSGLDRATRIWSGSRFPASRLRAAGAARRNLSGLALIAGFWTPLFAFVAFFMALNFQFAQRRAVQVQLPDERLRAAGAGRRRWRWRSAACGCRCSSGDECCACRREGQTGDGSR